MAGLEETDRSRDGRRQPSIRTQNSRRVFRIGTTFCRSIHCVGCPGRHGRCKEFRVPSYQRRAGELRGRNCERTAPGPVAHISAQCIRAFQSDLLSLPPVAGIEPDPHRTPRTCVGSSDKARRIPSRIGRAPAYLGRFSRALKADPVETLRSVPEAISSQLFDAAVEYRVEEDFGAAFHALLGLPWPCVEPEGLDKSSGRTSTGSSPPWDSPSVVGPTGNTATLIPRWARSRGPPSGTSRPKNGIETGVARGVTSRIILEAMALNGDGHLWSVDLPTPCAQKFIHEAGSAVSSGLPREVDLRPRLESVSTPALVSCLERVDMFVHDSLHTARNMRFELRTVWPAMDPGGLVLVDDVDNRAFRDFVPESGEPPSGRDALGRWTVDVRRGEQGWADGRTTIGSRRCAYHPLTSGQGWTAGRRLLQRPASLTQP